MKLYSASWLFPITSYPIRDGAMVVDQDQIFEIGSKAYLEKKYSAIPKKHFKNSVILPGFVNAHCHLVHSFKPEAPRDFALWYKEMVEAALKSSNQDWKSVAKKGLKELVHSGVTTVADSGPEPRVIKLIKKSGLRSIFYQEIFGFKEQDPDAWKNILTEETMHSRTQYGYAPHSPYTMPKQMFREISQYSAQVRTPITTHLAESKEENEFIQKGNGAISKLFPNREKEIPRSRSAVQYLYDNKILGPHLLAAHCVQVDDQDIELLAKSRVRIAYCPTSNQFLKVGKAPVKTYLYRELKVGLGTDSACTSGNLNFFQTLRDAALLGDLRPDQVIRMATFGGAQALGLEKEIGSLEKKKKADWIAIKLRESFDRVSDVSARLIWHMQPKDLIFSMVDGKCLKSK